MRTIGRKPVVKTRNFAGKLVKLDDFINVEFCRRCSGITVDIMDIGKIFRAGEAAHAAGGDAAAISDAVVAFTNTIRKN